MALYAKKEGESQPAEAVECELFMLPEQYSLSGIYPDQDGVRLEAADQESADVLLRHLRASGWTVTASPIWPRLEIQLCQPTEPIKQVHTRADRSGSHNAKPRAPTGGPAFCRKSRGRGWRRIRGGDDPETGLGGRRPGRTRISAFG